jgi:hypothetical protein
MRLACAPAVLAALSGTAHADGDALTDMLGPREIAVGEAMRGAATGATAIALNPAGLPLTREMVFEGGYGYRASDQASLIGVSACDSTNAVPGCFYYDYAGTSPELGGMAMHTTTHVGGLTVAWPVSPRVFIGAGAKYYHFDSNMASEPSSSGFTYDIGATARLTDLVNIGVAGYNLMGSSSEQFPRAAGGGLQAHLASAFAVSFDARWKLDGANHAARYGGGAELFVHTSNGQTGFPLRAGMLHDDDLKTTYLSAGIGLAGQKYGIDVAARTSVSGPDETMIIASMRFYGPRLPAASPSAP